MDKSITTQSLHKILIKAVKDVRAVNPYTDDLWISFCYDWNPERAGSGRNFSLDPARYQISFLSDFLAHASRECQNDASYFKFDSRPSKKCRSEPVWKQMRLTEIANPIASIWICVGQGELDGSSGSHGRFHAARVALPSTYVCHSGAAVAMFLQCVDSGLLTQLLGFATTPNFSLGCIHMEGKFRCFPRLTDKPHVNRMENMNNVLRSFGVDARASQQFLGVGTGRFLDPRLQHFVVVGCGSGVEMPCFHIEPDAFIAHLTRMETRVLVDEIFKNQVACGSFRNGVSLWSSAKGSDVVHDVLDFYGHDRQDTLVVHLHPDGVLLSPDAVYRREPLDILVPR